MDEDPSYDISVAREHPEHLCDDADIRRAVTLSLQRHSVSRAELSVALVADARITKLNRRFLNRRCATDVLSFDLGEGGECPLEGEVIVSVDAALREARCRGHEPRAELLLYVIHGTLHLLGYDDATPAGAQRMHTVEDEILGKMGFGPVYHTTRQ